MGIVIQAGQRFAARREARAERIAEKFIRRWNDDAQLRELFGLPVHADESNPRGLWPQR